MSQGRNFSESKNVTELVQVLQHPEQHIPALVDRSIAHTAAVEHNTAAKLQHAVLRRIAVLRRLLQVQLRQGRQYLEELYSQQEYLEVVLLGAQLREAQMLALQFQVLLARYPGAQFQEGSACCCTALVARSDRHIADAVVDADRKAVDDSHRHTVVAVDGSHRRRVAAGGSRRHLHMAAAGGNHRRILEEVLHEDLLRMALAAHGGHLAVRRIQGGRPDHIDS